jgi:eukaryotic-like serine/threonine-protein kinase
MRALSGSLVLGRYRIVRELARGGMGMVYLGRIEGAAGFSKPVVIKRILSNTGDEENTRGQFIREARILSELQHPGIVGVLDFGEEQDAYLMVLEYVHGYNLGYWLKYARDTRENLEWDFAAYALTRILGALRPHPCGARRARSADHSSRCFAGKCTHRLARERATFGLRHCSLERGA